MMGFHSLRRQGPLDRTLRRTPGASLRTVRSGRVLRLGLAAVLAAASPALAELVDTVDVSDVSRREAHSPTTDGAAVIESIGDLVGQHDLRRPAHVIRGNGSSLTYTLKSLPRTPLTLEVEELHGRETGVGGYTLSVNDTPTFFRTFRGTGAGPLHYFVQLPPEATERITVTCTNRSDTPFALSRLWLWSDLPGHVARSSMDVPFRIAPTVDLQGDDPDADLRRILSIKNSLGPHPHVHPAWTTWIPYAKATDDDLARRAAYILDLADRAGMPVQVCFDSWWGNTPDGADGQGGYWSDVQYQQVIYNRTRDLFQLSIPNPWSNTPWLTTNHPALNAFKTRRLAAAVSAFRREHNRRLLAGRPDPVLAINLDNEPVYWASGNAGLGSDLLEADFNRSTLAAAQNDGPALLPIPTAKNAAAPRTVPPLTFPQRLWLWRNLLAYHWLIASTTTQALGRGVTIIDAGHTTHPDPLRNNVYTQAMVSDPEAQYPTFDRARPFWESAAPLGARVGGEWNRHSLPGIEAVLHQLPLGRNAATNAECENDPANHHGVLPAYALAQRYYTPYNYPLDKLDLATSDLRDISQPFPAHRYEPTLLRQRFSDPAWRDAARAESVQTAVLGNTAVTAVFPASRQQVGNVTFHLAAPDRGAFAGLSLEFQARSFVYRAADPRVRLRVLAGATDDSNVLTEIAAVHDDGDLNAVRRCDLSEIARGLTRLVVRIEMDGRALPAEHLDWCALTGVQFTTPWPPGAPNDLPPQDESLATVRRQNLIVSWRRDAELAIAELPTGSDQAIVASARRAYDQGEYARACRIATDALSTTLPATYLVRSTGPLAPYPVTIDTPAPLEVTLIQCNFEGARFTAAAPHPTTFRVTLSSLTPGNNFAARQVGNEWIIQPTAPNAAGTLADDNGRITVTCTAGPAPKPSTVPTPLTGTVHRTSGRTVLLYPGRADVPIDLRVDAQTAIVRGPTGTTPQPCALTDLRRGDRVTADIAPNGVARKITADFLRLHGRVSAFAPTTPYTMPTLTLDGDPAPHLMDLGALLNSQGKPIVLKSLSPGARPVHEGQAITASANPLTGRIFELWTDDDTAPLPGPLKRIDDR